MLVSCASDTAGLNCSGHNESHNLTVIFHGFCSKLYSLARWAQRNFFGFSALISKPLVPIATVVTLGNASLYDVPGGYRAVMFDRFKGVKDKVCLLYCSDTIRYKFQLPGFCGRHSFLSSLASACYSLRCTNQTPGESFCDYPFITSKYE